MRMVWPILIKSKHFFYVISDSYVKMDLHIGMRCMRLENKKDSILSENSIPFTFKHKSKYRLVELWCINQEIPYINNSIDCPHNRKFSKPCECIQSVVKRGIPLCIWLFHKKWIFNLLPLFHIIFILFSQYIFIYNRFYMKVLSNT